MHDLERELYNWRVQTEARTRVLSDRNVRTTEEIASKLITKYLLRGGDNHA